MLGIVEYRESDEAKLARQDKSQFRYTKSIWAILIPVIYLILDALGTVGDQAISEFELFGMSEYASNTAFEFTSLCYAIFSIIWIKFVKKDRLFIKPEAGDKTLMYRRRVRNDRTDILYVGNVFGLRRRYADDFRLLRSVGYLEQNFP
mgnify:CR=1 FL=1